MSQIYLCIFLHVFIFQFILIQTADIVYPHVRRNVSIIDEYHGTKVADPYQWLEFLDSNETQNFISNQRTLSNWFLEGIGTREKIRERISQLVDYPKWTAPIKMNNKYFYFHNFGLQNHDVFYVQDNLDSDASRRIVVDPNTFSEDGSISMAYYKAVSPNAEVFVYSLSQSGSDWIIGRFVNTTSGIEFNDTLEFIKWPEFTWSKDGLGIFYSRFPIGDDGKPISENPQIYYHKLNTHQNQDKFIVDYSEHPQWFLFAEVTDCGNYLLMKPQPDWKANSVHIAKIQGSELISDFKLIFSADDGARFIYVTNNGTNFIFRSDHNAPNFRLIRTQLDFLNSNENQNETAMELIKDYTILVPEHEKNILKWVSSFDGNKLILCYFEDVKHKLVVRDLNNGSFIQDIPLEDGIINDYSISKDNNEFFFKFENLVTPGKIYRCVSNLETNKLQCDVHREMTLGNDVQLDLNDFKMEQVFIVSTDGTLIPMYIASKKNIALDGNAPGLLFGYGGFNVDLLPTFSPFNLAFIDYFGGVYAQPNIRGGAEYGEKWHEGGTILNKQNTFNDFQAAAEYLIEEKYTSASKLSIQGSSNGGLLVGACVNQRPDLFAIALPDVGLMDMLRFHKFTIGFAWCSEYGCSDNKTQFEYLYKYSPLHNIQFPSYGSYPAILVSTADNDDRVVPSHSFKYTAELQHSIGQYQKNSIILRIETNAGHNGDDKPINKRILDYVDSFAFIDVHLNQKTDDRNSAYKISGLKKIILILFFMSLVMVQRI